MAEKVLIADDDDGYRFPIVAMFHDEGADVIEVESKEQVIEQAPQADFWVIDVRLPTVAREGIIAVCELAKAGFRPQNPVIFISVDTENDAKKELDELRQHNVAYRWLEKPFELERLLNTIKAIRIEKEL
jgi:DNA-binding NtrC family response regulator